MILMLLEAWVHLVAGVLFVGCVLYWSVMALGMPGHPARDEGGRQLALLRTASWPPAGPLRVPFAWLGWVFLAALAVSGGLLLLRRGLTLDALLSGALLEGRYGRILTAKLGLVLLLAVGHGVALLHPRRSLAGVNLLLALTVLVASALLRR